ncbi:hypothetical protein FJK98_02345 [Micromonospora sp. HM134]|uniref:hypothetical protein n=1 Tax=Micromonospora sp. HM134 TaxID=2583243 RepID=UPI001198A981|nr:hypothetical protein [Micromonospora sp. HM134]QDY06145.1 hypothetical protein FJK98_02345 [Micromonospora sp. HM134]
MDDDQLRKLAHTRPGYATYPDSAPGSPSWWRRPVPGTTPGRPATRRDVATWRPARPGDTPEHGPVQPVDAPADELAEVAAAITEAAATGKAVWLPGGRGYVEPARRRWWHRITRRRAAR